MRPPRAAGSRACPSEPSLQAASLPRAWALPRGLPGPTAPLTELEFLQTDHGAEVSAPLRGTKTLHGTKSLLEAHWAN